MVGYLFGARFRSTLDKSWCALSRSGSSRCQHRRGLIVILGVIRSGRAGLAAFAVGGYITAAYWFTSSTSFANPAVTIGRTITNTFASIAPSSVPCSSSCKSLEHSRPSHSVCSSSRTLPPAT
jgi:hypothetical protein